MSVLNSCWFHVVLVLRCLIFAMACRPSALLMAKQRAMASVLREPGVHHSRLAPSSACMKCACSSPLSPQEAVRVVGRKPSGAGRSSVLHRHSPASCWPWLSLPSAPPTTPSSTTSHPSSSSLPRRSGILRMLLLAILTNTPKEAPKRPAPIVMVACGREGGRRRREDENAA